MDEASRSNSDVELFDAKFLTVPSWYFISVPASVARRQERFYESQNIIRNLTDTGVVHSRLWADAGQSQTRPVF
jgi:hypothetical protein